MRKIKQENNSKKRNNKIIALLAIIGIVAGIVYVGYRTENTSSSVSAVIDGIECNTNEFSVFHIHAHLDFYVNANHLTVPERIGIVDNKCLYWLHTHDASGIVHIESPKPKEFTLSQFIDIWKTTGDFPIFGATPKIFVNGHLVNSTMGDTKISKHDEIALVYGTVPSVIPSFYQFDPEE